MSQRVVYCKKLPKSAANIDEEGFKPDSSAMLSIITLCSVLLFGREARGPRRGVSAYRATSWPLSARHDNLLSMRPGQGSRNPK